MCSLYGNVGGAQASHYIHMYLSFEKGVLHDVNKSLKNALPCALCAVHKIEHKIHSTVLTTNIPYECAQETSMADCMGVHK